LRRPFLGLPRAVVRSAVPPDVEPWEDPMNADRTLARPRVRHDALPALEQALGPGVVAALARSAELLRDDVAMLDSLAATAWPTVARAARDDVTRDDVAGDGVLLGVDALASLPRAVRTRVLRTAAVRAGCPAGSLGAVHVAALAALVERWRGQGAVALPGGVQAMRDQGVLRIFPTG
jgi:tRNA(Ile)-lysidine synthase